MKADNGNFEKAVYQLQSWLQFLSRVNPKIMRVNPDGKYDTETENAVRQYQLLRGLTPTGIVDLNTWERLKADYIYERGKF